MKHRVVSQLISEWADALQTKWLHSTMLQVSLYLIIWNENGHYLEKIFLDCGALDLETYKHEK